MITKKMVVISIFCLSVHRALAAFGFGDVVYDPTAYFQKESQWIKQALEWEKELERWKQQFDLAKEQFKSISGIRDIGKLRALFSKFNFQKMIGDISNSSAFLDQGFGALDSTTRRVFDQLGIGSLCKNFQDSESKNLCESEIIYQMGNLEKQQQEIKELSTSVCKLKALGNRAMRSKDIKESQDIANQIAIVSTTLQVQQMRNQMRIQNEEKMKLLAEQKQKEIFMKKLDNIRGPSEEDVRSAGKFDFEREQKIKQTW